jgi:zinc transport system permease protein
MILKSGILIPVFVVGILISLCAALLGVNLVLKKYSMIGDGLSHVGFGALAVATALNVAPLIVAVPVVMLSAFLLLRISENSKIKGDAVIALISTSALAIGVMIVSLFPNGNVDISSYMFGTIIAVKRQDIYPTVILSVIVLAMYIFLYSKIFSVTFDEQFAQATGVKTKRYNLVIALLVAVTIVLGMRLMGALLISSLIIFPALTSMRIFKSFKGVTICSAILSVVSFVIGIAVTCLYSTPAGASIVCVNIILFLIFSLVGFINSRVKIN